MQKGKIMNPEKIEIIAGKVIEDFVKTHCEAGTIGIRDGLILVLGEKDNRKDFHGVQTFSTSQMQRGLSGPEWAVLAENLNELLTLEKIDKPKERS